METPTLHRTGSRLLGYALKSAEVMKQQGIPVNKDQAYGLLQNTNAREIEYVRRVSSVIAYSGLDSVTFLADHLIRLFGSRGSTIEANVAFEKIVKPSEYSWSSMIGTHSKVGKGEVALQLYGRMWQSSENANKYACLAVLKACTASSCLNLGRIIHDDIITSEMLSDIIVGNTLVDMYAKCGSLEEACKVFNTLQCRDEVSWGAMIAGYAHHGEALLALDCSRKMLENGLMSTKATYLSSLKACGIIGAVVQGRHIHQQLIGNGIQSDATIGNMLVNMYAKCGSLTEAREIFDKLPNRDVVSWSAILYGYVQHGEGLIALDCFKEMQQEGLMPTNLMFVSILRSCATIGAIQQGRHIHEQLTEHGMQSDAIVGTALIDMYARCGCLEEAQELFDNLPSRNIVTWGAMIGGYAQHGEGFFALNCFQKMLKEDILPNKIVFINVLKACGSLGAIGQGKHIHKQIIQSGLQADVMVMTTLVDMYAKCGSLEEARKVSESLPDWDLISWNTMITQYADQGDIRSAEQCLLDMEREGVKPCEMTFTSILAACSHSGQVDEGCKYFKCMAVNYGIIPDRYHCNCMVDILGRAGYLKEAETFLQIFKSNVIGWLSLLAACRTYGNVEIGRRCFEVIIQWDSHDASAYVLMSSIYSEAYRWKDTANIEQLRQHAGAWKKPAKAWIEVNNKVHEFIVGDRNHPKIEEIHAVLRMLFNKMKNEGYIPSLNLVLQDISDVRKEEALCGHCEKLAVAFGLVSTPAGATIRVTKNLRVCIDCHNANKIISKIERREIIIKDCYRVHHFKDGLCSCGDYQ